MHAELVEEVFLGEYRTSSFFRRSAGLQVMRWCAGVYSRSRQQHGVSCSGRKKEREPLHGESAVG